MRPRYNSGRCYFLIMLTFALGAVFIYAGVDKIRDPLQFADSIAAFAILPAPFINLLALALPPFEIACGILLLAPPTHRIAALSVTLTSGVFFLAMLSALLRGLTLDCGCFGSSTPSRSRMWLELGLDVILCGASLFIYFRSLGHESLGR